MLNIVHYSRYKIQKTLLIIYTEVSIYIIILTLVKIFGQLIPHQIGCSRKTTECSGLSLFCFTAVFNF